MLSPDRHRGALLGLAVGDVLGTTLEFNRPGTFEPITDMVGDGVFISTPANGRTTRPSRSAWPRA